MSGLDLLLPYLQGNKLACYYRHTSIHCASLCCTSQMLCFKIEGKALHQQKITTQFIVRLALLWWSGTEPVISLKYVYIQRSWQKTQDSWVRDKGLYYSQHSRQHKHYVCVSSPGPQILMGVALRGPDGNCTCCVMFTSQLRSLCLGSLLLHTEREIALCSQGRHHLILQGCSLRT